MAWSCCCCCCDQSEPFNGVRVIHVNGHVEGFDLPISACEVTGKPPYQLLFFPIHLLAGCAKPLRPDEQLEAGRFYFLLPHSVLKAAPADLAALATRLTTQARRTANSIPAKGTRPAIVQATGETGPSGGRSSIRRTRPWRPVLETIREFSFKMTMERRESMKSPAISTG